MIRGLFPAQLLWAAQEGNCQTGAASLPAYPPDSFFGDSGMGFEGHYNRCVWVCCGSRIRSGDTIRIIKLCGGMIGACPESWTLQYWNGNE